MISCLYSYNICTCIYTCTYTYIYIYIYCLFAIMIISSSITAIVLAGRAHGRDERDHRALRAHRRHHVPVAEAGDT